MKKKPESPSTRGVVNALASMLSDIDSAIDAAGRIAGTPAAVAIGNTLKLTRARVMAELTVAKLRHEKSPQPGTSASEFSGLKLRLVHFTEGRMDTTRRANLCPQQ